MKVTCLSETMLSARPHEPGALHFLVYGRGRVEPYRIGSVGANIADACRRTGIEPVLRAWDFLSIALAVTAADYSVKRSDSPDGWTRQIELEVSVCEPELWSSVSERLESALRYLSDDIWRVRFVGGGVSAPTFTTRNGASEDSVCLLSGGVDSLIGAIDLGSSGRRFVTVSQIADGAKHKQVTFSEAVAGVTRHFQANCGVASREPSQRTRSLLFIAYAAMVASSLDLYRAGGNVELFVPENGFISINVPLTPLRLGSLSTRTTHPIFMSRLSDLFAAAGIRVDIINPYQFKTKGEMMRECSDQALLNQLVAFSVSCGRFKRTGFQHCGRCVPCMVRRAAFHAWGHPDSTTKGYRYSDLSNPDGRHGAFDDVRSFLMALEQVRQKGIRRWMGMYTNVGLGIDSSLYVDVVERGLAEVRAFMRNCGAI